MSVTEPVFVVHICQYLSYPFPCYIATEPIFVDLSCYNATYPEFADISGTVEKQGLEAVYNVVECSFLDTFDVVVKYYKQELFIYVDITVGGGSMNQAIHIP